MIYSSAQHIKTPARVHYEPGQCDNRDCPHVSSEISIGLRCQLTNSTAHAHINGI